MHPHRHLFSVLLLALASGCQQQAAKISDLESAGATVSRGLDGSVTTVRFLTSNISPECVESLKGITSLKQIHGAGPELTDAHIGQLAALPAVEVLSVSNSKAASEAIAAVAKSKTLKHVDFSGCQTLTDDVAKGLNGLTHINILNLSNTPLTDASIQDIGSIANLEQLTLTGTKITTKAVESLADSTPKLKLLAIGSDLLSDATISAAAAFELLETLEVTESGLTGASLASLSDSPMLRKINLSGSKQLTNENVLTLGNLPALEYLSVEGSLFTSVGLNKSGFQKLSTLVANGTKVSDSDVANFTGLPVLYSVKLKGTTVTEGGVRKHFAPTSQTGFEWGVQ